VTIARNDLIVGVVLIALAFLYWFGADHIPKSILEGGIGADALPKMLGVTLGVLSLILVIQSALTARAAKDDVTQTSASKPIWYVHRYALGMLWIGIGYVVLVEFVGYVCAIVYLLGAVTLLAGGASRKAVVAFAVLGAIFFWALFVYALEIRQPKGFWPEIWKSLHSATADAQPQSGSTSPHSAS
jgi:hypothetical protein